MRESFPVSEWGDFVSESPALVVPDVALPTLLDSVPWRHLMP